MFVAAVVLYFHEGFGWLALVLLALAPDLAMIGYAAGERAGAATYDIVHTEALPIALARRRRGRRRDLALQLALIWLAHIGADRMLGYGLKYPSGFKDTDLQRV